MTDIGSRKKDHVELTLDESTQYDHSSGFDEYQFVHNALPEVDYNDVKTEALLLGRTFSMPLFISSMTGGYAGASFVNSIIAEVCETYDLPFGVGSQRVMLEDPTLTETFSVVRSIAPNAFICSNIGGAQLIGGLSSQNLKLLIDSIHADAVIVHLNPLQELMQPEGDRNFKGILAGIEELVKAAQIPVIAKETGAGISKHTAERLLNVGVQVLDVAGSGGTSWAKVENARSVNENAQSQFNNWGIPTVECLNQLSTLQYETAFEIIASGGIRSAFDMVKSICLGANFTASAQPIIKAVKTGGEKELEQLIINWKNDLRTVLTLLGVENISELSTSHLFKKT